MSYRRGNSSGTKQGAVRPSSAKGTRAKNSKGAISSRSSASVVSSSAYYIELE